MKTRVILAALLSALWMHQTASATSFVNLRYAGQGATQTAYLYNAGTSEGQVYTGTYNLQLNLAANSYSGSDAQNLIQSLGGKDILGTYCIDVSQNAPQTSAFQEYSIMPLESAPNDGAGSTAMSTAKANDLRRLYGRYYTDNFSNDQAAAFQACVWEIINEKPTSSYNVTNGSLYLQQASGQGDWTALANSWLSDLGNTPNTNLMALTNSTYQDYALVVFGFNSAPPEVPEPLTLLAVTCSIGALGAYIKRRRAALA